MYNFLLDLCTKIHNNKHVSLPRTKGTGQVFTCCLSKKKEVPFARNQGSEWNSMPLHLLAFGILGTKGANVVQVRSVRTLTYPYVRVGFLGIRHHGLLDSEVEQSGSSPGP